MKLLVTKVVLKEAAQEDIDELYFWKTDESKQEAKKGNEPYIPEEKIPKEEHRKEWEQAIFPGFPSALVLKWDGKAIGYVGAYCIDKNTNWLETGIVIYDPYYWNDGYSTKAYKLWIDTLFTSSDLHRLGMSTWSGNTRMVKVAEKLGMKEEGESEMPGWSKENISMPLRWGY